MTGERVKTMKELVYIGSSPAEEDCAQAGTEDFTIRNKRECMAYLHQLQRVYGLVPHGARLFIRTELHDFGPYREVVCEFDPDEEQAVDYAYAVETGCSNWDQEARTELCLKS